MSYKFFLFLFVISILSHSCTTQQKEKTNLKYNKIVTKHTEIRQMFSEEVGDTFYIYIKLPKKYDSTNKRYPVLYLLDGDIDFNMASSIVRYLQYGKELPEMIIVAPGYATMLSDYETNHRERDYTPSTNNQFNESGGAINYLNFLKSELLPFVDSSYRTNEFRVLNGYSLGGLFVINTFLEAPELFHGYIAGSPYLVNDESLLFTKIESHSLIKEKKKVFLSVGEMEDKNEFYKPINSIFTQLSERENIIIKFTEFKNGTHFTCPPEALTYGLQFVFSEYTELEP